VVKTLTAEIAELAEKKTREKLSALRLLCGEKILKAHRHSISRSLLSAAWKKAKLPADAPQISYAIPA
jgi:hypothetical protein